MLPRGSPSSSPFETYTNKTSAGTDILVTLHRVAEPDDNTAATGVSSPRPTVLLLGWYGSSRRNLSKYAVLFRNLGYHTVQTTAPTSVVFSLSGSSIQPFLLSVLRVLNADPRLLSGGLVVAAFSNGGACVLPRLVELFDVVREGTPSSSPMDATSGAGPSSTRVADSERSALPSSSPSSIFPKVGGGSAPMHTDDVPVVAAVHDALAAVVFDSAPCFLHPEAGIKALVEGIGVTDRPWLVALIRLGFLAFVSLQYFVYGNKQLAFWNAVRDARYPAPELYMYSAADHLLDEKALDELVSYRKSQGLASEIRVWRIEDAPHVQLFRTHPVLYVQKVQEINEWGINRFRIRRGIVPWVLPEPSAL